MNQPRNPVIIRKRVVKKVLDGENVTAVAKRFRVSRKFVYKWLKRYRENPYGEWWKERSRRLKNIQKKVTEEVRARIIELRREYGLNVMKIEQCFRRKGLKISHTTIWKVLKQEGEKSWRKKNRKTKARKRFERAKPNELWQIDIKGPMWCEEQGQYLYLLTIIDDHSRFMIGAKFYIRPVRNHDILSELHKAISKYGKPLQILTDNGSQFYAVNGGTSTFTRWCMQDGIEHIRSRVFHPQTCGKVERTHGIIVREFKRLGLPFATSLSPVTTLTITISSVLIKV